MYINVARYMKMFCECHAFASQYLVVRRRSVSLQVLRWRFGDRTVKATGLRRSEQHCPSRRADSQARWGRDGSMSVSRYLLDSDL